MIVNYDPKTFKVQATGDTRVLDIFRNFHFLKYHINANYEENVMISFKSNLLLMIFWLHLINYNS